MAWIDLWSTQNHGQIKKHDKFEALGMDWNFSLIVFQSLDAEKNDNTSKIIEKLTFMNLKLTGNNSTFSEIVLFHGYFFPFIR